MKKLPRTVRWMYVTSALFWVLLTGLIALDVIGSLAGRPHNGDTLDRVPVWVLITGLVWYWMMAASYLLSLFFGIVNIARLIRRPTVHFYASCAICIAELGAFLGLWFWPH